MKPSMMVTLLILSAAGPAMADVAPEPEYGQSLAPRKPCKVELVEEHVRVTMKKDSADVSAVFLLQNTGPSTEFEVGFPDTAMPKVWGGANKAPTMGSPKLRNLRVWVSGSKCSTTYVPAKDEKGKWKFLGWTVWKMSFGENWSRKVRVEYSVDYVPPYGGTLMRTETFTYILTTGTGWKGPIGKAVIDIELAQELPRSRIKEMKPEGAEETLRGWRWTMHNFEPKEDIEIVVSDFRDTEDAASTYYQEYNSSMSTLAHNLPRLVHLFTELNQHGNAIHACRRLSGLEKLLHRFISPYKSGPAEPFLPWECRIVDLLLKEEEYYEVLRKNPRTFFDPLRRTSFWSLRVPDEYKEKITLEKAIPAALATLDELQKPREEWKTRPDWLDDLAPHERESLPELRKKYADLQEKLKTAEKSDGNRKE